MLLRTSSHAIRIVVSDASQIENAIDEAVQSLIEGASARKCGILVVRRDGGHYEVKVDETVAFGQTLEVRN